MSAEKLPVVQGSRLAQSPDLMAQSAQAPLSTSLVIGSRPKTSKRARFRLLEFESSSGLEDVELEEVGEWGGSTAADPSSLLLARRQEREFAPNGVAESKAGSQQPRPGQDSPGQPRPGQGSGRSTGEQRSPGPTPGSHLETGAALGRVDEKVVRKQAKPNVEAKSVSRKQQAEAGPPGGHVVSRNIPEDSKETNVRKKAARVVIQGGKAEERMVRQGGVEGEGRVSLMSDLRLNSTLDTTAIRGQLERISTLLEEGFTRQQAARGQVRSH